MKKIGSPLLFAVLVLMSTSVLRAGDVDFQLTTNNGTTNFSIKDSASVEVSSINSDGDAYFRSITQTGTGGNLILNTNTLQSGSTFYVSSGTVGGQISVNSLRFPDGTVATTTTTIPSRSLIGHWGYINLTASLTNTQLLFDVGGAAQIAAGSRVKMPFNGIARGICVSGSAARSAGTATFQVFKNGSSISTSSDALIDATNTQFVCSTTGTGTFVATDILDIRVTTNAAFAPITTEYTADIIVEWTN